ncbi:RNA polymerase II associated Paf1 complex [Schizosaccharomyces japonicus yFS275]|uniref:RNA polymerase II associated Paf1 complex n=1 Tax=Schizosaccharomyces japonicus (strain yFS275 / FY16936) TaxID=402676 RepID=B6K3D4_SCHJY|nr:RNA polymerase II associated Paf1 complex [Schizosaccharomyces japonicus yFS275]EEB07991.2 RNA polymerase II associated Paf1 complex [Schizosaccharomyces japonicus yFS275]
MAEQEETVSEEKLDDLFGDESDGHVSENESKPQEGTGDASSNVSKKQQNSTDNGGKNEDAVDDEDEKWLFSDEEVAEGHQEQSEGEEQEPEAQVKVFEAKVPNYHPPGKQEDETIHAHMPNFLSMEQRPFDHEVYRTEAEADAEMIEHNMEWGQMIKHKVDNTIRWRFDENGKKVSNAQLVQWSDGTYSLRIGNDIFDAQSKPVSQPTFLTVSHEAQHLLRVQASFKQSLTFLPSAINTAKTARAPAMRYFNTPPRTRGVQEIITEKDPELLKRETEKYEEERNRARRRLEKRKIQNGARFGLEEDEGFPSYMPRHEDLMREDNERVDRLQRIKQAGAGYYENMDEDEEDDFIADEEEEEAHAQSDEEEEARETASEASDHGRARRLSEIRSNRSASESVSTPVSASATSVSSQHTETQRRPKRRIIESDSE